MSLNTTIGIFQKAAAAILSQQNRTPQDVAIAEALYNWASSYGPHLSEPFNLSRQKTVPAPAPAAGQAATPAAGVNAPQPQQEQPVVPVAPAGRHFATFAEWREQHEKQQADEDPFA